MRKYIELESNAGGFTHLKAETYYHLGNSTEYRNSHAFRGYYLSVTPVTRENKYGYVLETITAFTGLRTLVKPVNRKSTKAEASAEAAAEKLLCDLVQEVCNKNGLPIPAAFAPLEVQ